MYDYCLDLHDLVETHIWEGKIDQYGNSLAPANKVSQRAYGSSPESQALYPKICEYYHHPLGYGRYKVKAEMEQFKIDLFQYRMRISKEVATKPISQQAEEFVDHYHQLPSSIIQEAINAIFENGSLSALKISQFQKSQQLYIKRRLQQEKHLQIIFRAESHKLN